MQGGRIGVVGVYAGFTNHFNIGAFMEKGLTMRAGQVPLYPVEGRTTWRASRDFGKSIGIIACLRAPTCGCVLRGLLLVPGGAQTPVQRYWKDLLKYIQEGKLTPEMVGTALKLRPCSSIHCEGAL